MQDNERNGGGGSGEAGNEKHGFAKMHADHRAEMFPMNNWRAWGSWFSWGSPVGLGLGWMFFIIPLGVFLWLLHLANIIH